MGIDGAEIKRHKRKKDTAPEISNKARPKLSKIDERTLGSVLMFGIIIGVILAACVQFGVNKIYGEPEEEPWQRERSGVMGEHLGHPEEYPGTYEQATRLVEMISSQPNMSEYYLAFRAPGETITITCSFTDDMIVRTHVRDMGGGTHEVWFGYLVERLDAAASGGTLNDTPEGKKLVHWTRLVNQ